MVDSVSDLFSQTNDGGGLARTVLVVSGVSFSSFLSLHLANAAAGLGGEHLYDGVLSGLRAVTRLPAVETLILASAGVHCGAAVILMSRREEARRRFTRKESLAHAPTRLVSAVGREVASLWGGARALLISHEQISVPRVEVALHRLSGVVIAGLLPNHVFFVRTLPALVSGREYEFAGLQFSLREWPIVFYPYYILLGAAGSYHMVYGLRSAWRMFRPRRKPGRRSKLLPLVAGAASVLIAASVLRIGGVLDKNAFYDPRPWRQSWDKYAQFFGAPDALTRLLFSWKRVA